MGVFQKLEQQAQSLREAIAKQVNEPHQPAVAEQVALSLKETEIVAVRMTACRLATELPSRESDDETGAGS